MRRQKAEKDADRRKKNESATLLQSYRAGGVDPTSQNLLDLKREDREKHLEAERHLHNYRSKDAPVDSKKRPERMDVNYPQPEGPKEDNFTVEAGSVSAKAAALDFGATPKAADVPTTTRSSHKAVVAEEPTETTSAESEETAPPKQEDAPQPQIVEEKKSDDSDQQPLTAEAAQEIADNTIAKHANGSVDFAVLFSFGLVTSSQHPKFDRYMNAVSKILQSMLSFDKKLSSMVQFDPTNGPRVKEYSFDRKWIVRGVLLGMCTAWSHTTDNSHLCRPPGTRPTCHLCGFRSRPHCGGRSHSPGARPHRRRTARVDRQWTLHGVGGGVQKVVKIERFVVNST